MGTHLDGLKIPFFKGALLMLLVVFASMAASGSLLGHDDLIVTAATIDLLITVPVAYWLFIRRASIPKITVVPVFLAAVLLGAVVIPSDRRWLLDAAVSYVVPGLELFVLGYIGLRAFRIRRAYLAADPQMDVMERLRAAFTGSIEPLIAARAAAFEVGLIALVFFKWRRPSAANSFTYHRKCGAPAILCVFLFLLAAETLVLHVLIHQWSAAAAWIATALSVYFSFQVAAHLKGVLLRPIVVGRQLRVRCGILGDAVIPRSEIRNASVVDGNGTQKGVLSLTPIGTLSAANVQITLSTPATVNGIYGFSREATEIMLFVDEPQRFIDLIAPGAEQI